MRSGTGFLIGACTVLTAYHVLFPLGETPSKKAKFIFAIGHGGPTEFATVAPATPVYWGDFSYERDTPTEDFAVLRVPSCPGRHYSPIPLAAMSLDEIEADGGKVQNAGYPTGHSRGRVWGDDDCALGGMHPLEPALFAVDCPAIPGMSGGPVFAEKNGQLQAVAIMSRAVVDAEAGQVAMSANDGTSARLARFNEALPVSAFLSRLREKGLLDN